MAIRSRSRFGAGRRGWPIQAYLYVLVAIFVLSSGAAAGYWYINARDSARQGAITDGTFGARAAAIYLSQDLVPVQSAVTGLAANPAVTQLFAHGGCSLSFSSGTLDVLNSQGVVGCSSTPADIGSDAYVHSSWLASALQRASITGPAVDPLTRHQVLVFSAPIPHAGAVVGLVDLQTLGAGLATQYGGRRHLEFLVVDTATQRIVTDSTVPARWAGVPVATTPFGRATGSSRTGVDGVGRYYGSASVTGLPWAVYAGASRATTVATANSLFRRQLEVILGGLVALLLATAVISRRITNPIRALDSAVSLSDRAPGVALSTAPRGPAEIRRLAEHLEDMTSLVHDHVGQVDQTNRVLAETQNRLQNFLDRAPALIWLTDPDGRFLLVNQRLADRFQTTRQALIGRLSGEVFPGAMIAQLNQRGPGETDTDPSPAPVEFSIEELGGAVSTYEVLRFSLLDDRQRVVAVGSIATDVTDSRAGQARREDLESQLAKSQRLESLGQLAGGVAHDFNNLLAVMLNYTAFSLEAVTGADGASDLTTVREDLEQVLKAGERASRLVRQLLTFARRDVTKSQVINVTEVLTGLHELLRRSVREDIQLQVNIEDGDHLISGDASQFEQVIVNLSVNARDAMPDGGHLIIDAQNVHLLPDEIFTSGSEPGWYVRLRVSDTGTGMTREIQDRIFEPFFSTKRAGQGTGLGLATVYGIVTRAGGSIRVYSEPELGTTFTILWPLTEARAAPGAVASGRTQPRYAAGQIVLLVEDEEALLQTIRRMLERHGFTVIEALNGSEALQVLEDSNQRVDLLLTDVVLPHILGTELARSGKRLRPEIAVVYMSGYAQPVLSGQDKLDNGAILVEKPFTESDLMTKVNASLRTSRHQSGTVGA